MVVLWIVGADDGFPSYKVGAISRQRRRWQLSKAAATQWLAKLLESQSGVDSALSPSGFEGRSLPRTTR